MTDIKDTTEQTWIDKLSDEFFEDYVTFVLKYNLDKRIAKALFNFSFICVELNEDMYAYCNFVSAEHTKELVEYLKKMRQYVTNFMQENNYKLIMTDANKDITVDFIN